MKVTIEKSDDFVEAKFEDVKEFEEFYKLADTICDKLKSSFVNKVDDFDSLYWEFLYSGVRFILHYNTYLGISIYPHKSQQVTGKEEDILRMLLSTIAVEEGGNK
ncbi:MAG: hypothetical protein J0M08_12070 [Bacteroidetes bacterium]|nr:hypothetical protein [Bacteroidota bacterium]